MALPIERPRVPAARFRYRLGPLLASFIGGHVGGLVGFAMRSLRPESFGRRVALRPRTVSSGSRRDPSSV
ncbi:MAG: hypothetical protein QF890_02470 [Myxococcota bacterium]|jgi:hypothetical protein|nr:hypothetical protein [Deltaproteobacteria bacterium]MCP4242046.1 hypothetical protein [bacterium]MDP6075367.1 hypothetical protein [Myxococcota bacterium]MDP6242778.1 hypothetical protein [Myxococcota bacterium]MDP7301402.1 hypothetical protein [Myxococcota bacterium]